MSMPLRDLVSHEVSELPQAGGKTFRFSGAIVRQVGTLEEVTVRGPVDLDVYGTVDLTFTDRVTGAEVTRQGLTLLVVEDDGVPIPERRLNLLSVRLIEQLHALLASGGYLKERIRIIADGQAAPKTRYGLAFPDREL